MNRKDPRFELMLAESKRLGLPLRFQTDLTEHDRAALARAHRDDNFVWCLYEHGTHLAFMGHRDRGGFGPADLVKSLAHDYPETKFYIWDGCELIPFGPRWQEVAACIREQEQRDREEAAQHAP